MDEISTILQHKEKIEHGSKEIRTLVSELYAGRTKTENMALIQTLFMHAEVAVRMVATLLAGMLAAQMEEALAFLRDEVSRDNDWRVQEILAQAFDRYCSEIGYEAALPIMTAWLQDEHAHVRRAAAEGPRIWTTRPYFKQHPEIAIKLLSTLKADESAYVRKSAGNALRDISRKQRTLVGAEVQTWDCADKRVLFTYKLASKFLE
jgi:HEAT repeat protein